MASISDIVQADSYRGNPDAGGAGAPAIKLDTDPFNQMNFYVNAYGKQKHDEEVTDRNAKIQEIAKVSQIDLNNVYGKDKGIISKDLDALKSYAIDYAKNPNRTLQEELKWQSNLGAVQNKYASAKARSLSYYKQIDDFSGDDAAMQNQKQKELDDVFNKTGIEEQLPTISKFKPVNVSTPPPQTIATEFNVVGSNDNESVKAGFYNPQASDEIATQMEVGLHKLFPDKNSAEYAALSPKEKIDADRQNLEAGDSEAQQLAAGTQVLNSVLQKKDANGNLKYFTTDQSGKSIFNADAFAKDNSGNKIIYPLVKHILDLNKYATDKINQIRTHSFSDQGLGFATPSNLTEDQFKAGQIEITPDGLQTHQVIQGAMYGKYNGDTYEKKLTHTGEVNDLIKANIQATTTRRGQNLNHDEAMAKLKQDKKQFETLHPDTTLPSNEFGNLIYGVNTLVDKGIRENNVIPGNVESIKSGTAIDKDGNVATNFSGVVRLPVSSLNNSIISEYKKAAGSRVINKVDDQGVTTTTTTTGTGDVDLSGGVSVRFQSGVISGIQAQDGSFIDDNQFQHITLEAGQAGTTKYKKADTNYGKQDAVHTVDAQGNINTHTPETIKQKQYDVNDQNNWKQEGNNFRFADGSLYKMNLKTNQMEKIK